MNPRAIHQLASLLCTLTLLTGIAIDASAQTYPSRPVRVIVPFPPGGGTDVPARAVIPRLSELMGQPFLIDNRAGANGIVGTDAAAKSAPDGYTLLMVPGGHTINPALYKSLPFDTVKDLASVSLIANGSYVMAVNNNVPAKTVAEFVALAKTKPGQLNYGHGGVGNANHLAAELMAMMSGIKVQAVPYKGGGPMLTDLLGGHIVMIFATVGTIAGEVKAGKVRALGVSTPARSSAFPDLPTIAEAGVPGYEVSGWYAMLAPARTPGPVINQLSQTMAKAVHAPDIKEKLVNGLGLDPVGSTPAVLDQQIQKELKKWAEVIKALGITAEG